MKIERLIRGELEANGYIIYDDDSMLGYIIDPGYDKCAYEDKLKELDVQVEGILLTHHHYDHVGAALELAEKLNVPIYIHKKDSAMLIFRANVLLSDGEVLPLGKGEIKLIHTPGHTKGSSCFLIEKEKVAFTGDTIFNVDLGRTDLTDGSPYQMIESIRNVVSKWEDDVIIYPGHGDPSTMEDVRKYNYEYQEIMKG